MKHFTYKILAVLLAVFTLAASLPLAAFASGIENQAEAPASESGTEPITSGETPEYLEMSDGYISVMVSKKNGGFHVGTAEGDLLTKGDDHKDLMYSDDDFDTSFTTFRITREGKTADYIFGRDYAYMGVETSAVTVSQAADNAIIALWTVDGITIRQTISLMGADTYQHGMAYVAYTAVNASGSPVEKIEARVLLDTALGSQDYGYYMLGQPDGSYVAVEEERTFSGSDYFNYFFAYDNKTTPSVTAYMLNGTVGGRQVVPERVTFAHWMDLASTKFDYTPAVQNPPKFTETYGSIHKLTADSAFALYYDMGNAAEESGSTICLYYGVYSNYKADAGDVAVNFTSSGTMFFNEDETAYTDLNGSLPGNFSSTIKLTNTAEQTFGSLSVAVFHEDAIQLHSGSSFVTSSREDPYFQTVTELKPGETRDVRFDFNLAPTLATGYRRIRLVVYSASDKSGFTDENRIAEKELFVLCPGATGTEVSFTGMTPESVFMKGKRFAYITGTNFDMIRDTTQYRVVLRPADGSEDVVLDMDKVVVNPERNTVTLVLDMELRPTTYRIILDWNDTSIEDMQGDTLELVVTDIPSPGDPGYVSSGVYGVITVERNRETLHYELVNYESEEAYRSTETKPEDILLVLRGDFNVLSSEERPNFKAEAVTLMPGEFITINDCMEVKEGRVTITKVYDEQNNQTAIDVDIDGKLYTAVANTKVWDGVLALTSIEEGTLYTLPVYDGQGIKGFREGEAEGETITLLWPGAAGVAQTIAGMLLSFRYGELAVMEQGESVERVLSFGAALDPSILVPPGMVGTRAHYSNLEQKQREMGVSSYTAAQLRATDLKFRKDQANWRNKQIGTLNLYMDDILFGAGGFIGFNTSIEVGIPSYTEPLPYIRGTLDLKIINDYWEVGVDGEADMMVFEVEATLRFKSYQGIPVPDEIYFFIGGKPGIPVDPFGVFWVRGAGAGIGDIYETFFGGQTVPPLTLMLSGQFALFGVLEARADVSLSARGIEGYLNKVGIAGITVIDRVGGGLYWYPNFSVSFAIRVDILDCIIGEGGIVLKETEDGLYFCGYATAKVKIPDFIFLIGGIEIGSASVGIDTEKVWGSVRVIGVGVGIKYHWGGDVDVAVGKTFDVPSPLMLPTFAPVPVYTDEVSGKTLYMTLANDVTPLSDTVITTSADGRTHSFTLDASANEDALLAITYPAANRFMAQDIKNTLRMQIGAGDGAEAYALEWYDDRVAADDPLNREANAMFRYDEEAGIATVSVSVTDSRYYGHPVSLTASAATELDIFGIGRLATMDSVSVNSTLTEATVEGSELQRLNSVSLYAEDGDGERYLLGDVQVEDSPECFTAARVTIPVSIPMNLPTGEYTLRAVGVGLDDRGAEVENPMTEGLLTYENPHQPTAPSGAVATLTGSYTITTAVTTEDTNRDGFLSTIYEVTEEGMIPTVFANMETPLEGDGLNSLATHILLGGRYDSLDENGNPKTIGLEAERQYVVAVQSYKTMEDGTRLLSQPTLTEAVTMTAPLTVEPTFSVENAASVEFGGTEVRIDTVKESSLTIQITAENFGRGTYRLNEGAAVEWDGTSIPLADLEDGFYTLTVEGVSVTNDAFTAKYQFSVDTLAPSILVSSHQGGGFFEGDSATFAGVTESGATLEAFVEGQSVAVGTADGEGNFSLTIPLDESIAYQSVILLATDAAGNVSMPFGCELTNSILGDPDVKGVILYNGREVSHLAASTEPKQLAFAFKLDTRYVTINRGTTAASKVVWSTDVIAGRAAVTADGQLSGSSKAAGIVTARLEGFTAVVELVPVNLADLEMSLDIPAGGLIYDGTEQKPAVRVESDTALTEGVDYTVTYLDNRQAGTASAVVTATEEGKCIGVRILNFTIQKRSFEDLTITVAEDGSERPAVTLTFGETALQADTDYTVTYTLRPDGRQVIVTVEGIGNYEGLYSVFRSVGGTSTPGGDDPGTDDPGGDNPGGDNPGGDNPGGDNPGGNNPGGNDQHNGSGWILPVAVSVSAVALAALALFLVRKRLGYIPFIGARAARTAPEADTAEADTAEAEDTAPGESETPPEDTNPTESQDSQETEL